MSKISFQHDGEWWFDPESGEYEYDGPSVLIDILLENLGEMEDKETEPLWGISEHPGEVWTPLSPEERKDKVLKYLSRVDGVKINERQTQRN